MRSQWRLAQSFDTETIGALVIWLENRYPTHGTPKAYSLIASIRAHQQIESVTVARGYWTGQTYNEVTIDPGAELGIIVGHFEMFNNKTFVVYDNPHAPPSGYSIVDDGFRPRGHKAKLELVIMRDRNIPLTITVTIAQLPTHEVIACKNISIELPQRFVTMTNCGEDPYSAY
jgi:hypothetical protein